MTCCSGVLAMFQRIRDGSRRGLCFQDVTTRAERGAFLAHRNSCRACRELVESWLEDEWRRATPEERAAALANGTAVRRGDECDPEFREKAGT